MSDPFDDRVHCATCSNFRMAREVCTAFARGTHPYTPTTDIPRRCELFKPRSGDPDQRTGAERWPMLTQ